MLPRLRAQEAIQRVNELAVGTGSVKPEAARRMMSRWEYQAKGYGEMTWGDYQEASGEEQEASEE